MIIEVDESSLVLESSLIGALLSSDRFVLVGDAKQLKPLVQSKEASAEGMSTSLFERLITAHSSKHAVTLDKQFRMNRVVSSVASSLFYDGRLSCANEKVAEACLNSAHERYEGRSEESKEVFSSSLTVALDGSIDNSAIFIDVPSGNEEGKDEMDDSPLSTTVSISTGGIVNEREVEIVKKLVEEFTKRGLPTSSIGVAAVYNKQVDLLRRSIPTGIEVNTVDKWQGRDAEVVICSLAWTTLHGRKRSELLSDEKRINVALTRAKYKMIFIGCVRSMREKCPIVASVIDRVKVVKV
uniref:DNA replication ATP-dependent helicase/nuclease n=1 Tax=Pristionchus pacificus TaxID=54126 RepID=A0A2A6CZ76_PRIPA|eukprot:PDM83410.1 dna-2 [Pristionchus pacificus]